MEKPLLDQAIEELATAVVMADADDPESIDAVRRGLEKLNTALPGAQLSAELSELVKTCVTLEKRLGLFGPEADAEALIALSDAVGRLQTRFGKAARAVAAGKGTATAAADEMPAPPSGGSGTDSPPHQPPRASHAPVAATATATATAIPPDESPIGCMARLRKASLLHGLRSFVSLVAGLGGLLPGCRKGQVG